MYLSGNERERRYRLLREVMAAEHIEVLLVMGNSNSTGNAAWATGSFRYLTDFFIFSHYGILLFFREGDPILLISMELLESRAKKYSWVADVRISPNYSETVTHLLKERRYYNTLQSSRREAGRETKNVGPTSPVDCTAR